MSKVEMTKIGVPSWLTHGKTVKEIDRINDELDKLVLSTATDTKAARESLLASAMAGEISAAEFVERSSKIRNATTQSEIDVATVRLLKQKKSLTPKIKALATEAAKDWEKKADAQERMIKDSLAKLDLREAARHTVLSSEKTLRRYRETARGIQASGHDFWTSGDAELLRAIEQRLSQSLGIFNANQY